METRKITELEKKVDELEKLTGIQKELSITSKIVKKDFIATRNKK
jgi:hypothetical protein